MGFPFKLRLHRPGSSESIRMSSKLLMLLLPRSRTLRLPLHLMRSGKHFRRLVLRRNSSRSWRNDIPSKFKDKSQKRWRKTCTMKCIPSGIKVSLLCESDNLTSVESPAHLVLDTSQSSLWEATRVRREDIPATEATNELNDKTNAINVGRLTQSGQGGQLVVVEEQCMERLQTRKGRDGAELVVAQVDEANVGELRKLIFGQLLDAIARHVQHL